MSQLVLNFTNKDQTSDFRLKFRLHSNEFVEKWLRLLRKSLAKDIPIKEGGVYYGQGIHDQEDLRQELLAMAKQLKIDLMFPEKIDQKFLDELHKEFERLSHLENAYILNNKIHQYESTLSKPSFNFSMSVNFASDEEIALEDEDFDLFTPDTLRGGVYLNYATVGVPVLEGFLHQDRGELTPQKKYRADFNVCFDPTSRFNRRDEMKKWLYENYGWDINDKKLAIGYIPLAILENLENLTSEQIFQSVRSHRVLKKVELF